MDKNFWSTIKVCVKVLEPAVKVFRYRASWSIQGWIHSKRRNRLGQDLVERLVCTPLSDDEDEDGVPHCVSDSESESENDSD